ncbi:MAG: ketopantoate reductase family protein [Neisseriaceae bacterium]|nr:ketopantoate reductase family protein [Neisseriaceae bacterium]
MKITLLGAGSMGALFGGLLAEQGHVVTLVDINDEVLQAMTRHGLRLETDEGVREVSGIQCQRPETLTEPIEWLWVLTKTHQTTAAMAGIQHRLSPESWVMSVQNGLGNLAKLEAFVPRSQILIGTTTWPADKPAPNHVVTHGQGEIHFMAADGGVPAVTEAMADMLNQAGLHAIVVADVWATVWAKVAFNCALNGLCTVLNASVDQLSRLPDGERLAFGVVAEVIAVATAQGIRVDQQAVQKTVQHAIATHTGHLPSMLQDWRSGRPTEIEALNGEVVALADQYRIPVPLTATLLGLVRLLSAPRKEAV